MVKLAVSRLNVCMVNEWLCLGCTKISLEFVGRRVLFSVQLIRDNKEMRAHVNN
jgi:hypothetical protein